MISGICAGLVWLVLMNARGATRVIFLNLPATAAHELSHWVVALVTGCRPGFPSMWPSKQTDGSWVLGSVTFDEKPHVSAAVALAPLALALVAGWGILVRPSGHNLSQEVWLGIVFGFMAWGAVPSRQDWSVALKHPLGMVSVLTVFSYSSFLLWEHF